MKCPVLLYLTAVLAVFMTGCAGHAANKKLLDQTRVDTLKLLAECPLDIPEPSGIAWDGSTSTLFVVSDRIPAVFEVSEQGETLGQTPVNAGHLEGISLDSENDLLWVVQEEPRLLLGFSRKGELRKRFNIKVPDSIPTKGLEGVACVPSQNCLFVVNERVPGVLIQVDDQGLPVRYVDIPYAPDLSGLCAAPGDEGLFLLSDMAASMYWIRFDGTLRAWWKLPIKKAEGVAVDSHSRVFIVSDTESKMYVFQLPAIIP